jgi:hypothetical protein
MARTLSEIQTVIINKIQENEEVSQKLTSTSTTAIWRQMVYAVAFAIWSLEVLWDIFRAEINTEMAKQRVHTKQWYRQKALDFQYGFPVIDETDLFDNTGATEADIEASKIIKQAACIKMISGSGYGILRIKAARQVGEELQPLTEPQLDAVKHYFDRYAVDAGTQLIVTSKEADDVKLSVDVYYDPLVIGSNGARIDGTAAAPVLDGIKEFLKSLEFNGALIIDDLQRKIRSIDGVKTVRIKEARSKYSAYTYETTGVPNAGLIDEIRIADAGYMKLDEDNTTINYKPFNE